MVWVCLTATTRSSARKSFFTLKTARLSFMSKVRLTTPLTSSSFSRQESRSWTSSSPFICKVTVFELLFCFWTLIEGGRAKAEEEEAVATEEGWR